MILFFFSFSSFVTQVAPNNSHTPLLCLKIKSLLTFSLGFQPRTSALTMTLSFQVGSREDVSRELLGTLLVYPSEQLVYPESYLSFSNQISQSNASVMQAMPP